MLGPDCLFRNVIRLFCHSALASLFKFCLNRWKIIRRVGSVADILNQAYLFKNSRAIKVHSLQKSSVTHVLRAVVRSSVKIIKVGFRPLEAPLWKLEIMGVAVQTVRFIWARGLNHRQLCTSCWKPTTCHTSFAEEACWRVCSIDDELVSL